MNKKKQSAANLQTFPVELLPLSKIDPLFEGDLRNPNHLPADKLKLLSAAMEQYGFLQPILVRERENTFQVLDGHHRIEAARKAGFTQIQAVVLPETADFRAIGHAIGLNRLRGDFDITTAAELMGMMQQQADLDAAQISLLTGFTTKEVEALLQTDLHATAELLDAVASAPDLEEEPKKMRPFVLELQFENKEMFQRVKRALKKASGAGQDYAEGLINVLGLDDK